MAALVLGLSVGFFQYAFVNSRYNEVQWMESKYSFAMGVILLGVSGYLFFF